MSNTTLTPNMSLIVPTPGSDPGPDYANNQNQDLAILDSHNHSPGSGVQVTPSGLNINSNLPFNNNSVTGIFGVQFSAPASSNLLGFLYTNAQSGGGITDLFYNDGAGNVIALTKAGEVNATIASLPGESYSGGTFTWKQGSGSTVPANFDIGSITIRPNTAGTVNGVTVGPPSGISSAYNIFLPALAGSTLPIVMDSSGNQSASQITGAQIASNTITASNLAVSVGINPAGTIIMFGGTATPTGYLFCDGSAVSRTTYANLYAAISTNYGIGDGTTTFNLPQGQGMFMRGVDNGAGNDPDATSRTSTNGGGMGDIVGSAQASAVAQHEHIEYTNSGTGGGANTVQNTVNGGNTISINSTGGVVGPAVSTETRPINIYINFYIKY
jgi:microcystin-dependent protein